MLNGLHTTKNPPETQEVFLRWVLPGGVSAKWLRGLDLNQRPLGYEPNELPGCSTPQLQFSNRAARGQSTRTPSPRHPVHFSQSDSQPRCTPDVSALHRCFGRNCRCLAGCLALSHL